MLAEIIQGLAPDIDARLAGECLTGAVNRIAIHRRLGTLPRRLTEYEGEIAAAVVASVASVGSCEVRA